MHRPAVFIFKKSKISQTKALGKQEVSTMMAIKNGMKEKTILKVLREHYTAIHPTQKPVRLLERLIRLCLPNKFNENIWVADFFAGSFSTGEACYNLGVNFIGYEIDKEYFDAGSRRMEEIQFQTKLL